MPATAHPAIRAVLNPHEFYETPYAMTRWLFEEVGISGLCYDPCAGTGAIPKIESVDRWWVTNDIDRRFESLTSYQDATTAAAWPPNGAGGLIEWTVTNPPFSLAPQILEYALRHSRIGVAMHLRLSFHEPTIDRRELLYACPPSGILILPRFAYMRSPKTGEWSTDSVTSCWTVWIKDHPHRPAMQRIMYMPEPFIAQLRAETDAYRTRIDEVMAHWVELATPPTTNVPLVPPILTP